MGRRGSLPWTRNGTSRDAWRSFNSGSGRKLDHFARAGQPERCGNARDPQGNFRRVGTSGKARSGRVCQDRGERQREAGNAVLAPETKDPRRRGETLAACAGEPCGAVPGEFPAILATGAFETAMGRRHRCDQRLHCGARSGVEYRSNEPIACLAPWRAARSLSRRSHEQLEANCGNGERSAMPVLPGYRSREGRVRGGIGGAYFSCFDVPNARRG